MAFLLLVGSSAWADAGDVTKNADIDFSNAISEGVVTGTVNSMTIGGESYLQDGWLRLKETGNCVVTIPEAQRAGSRDVVNIQFKRGWGNKNGMGSGFSLTDADGGVICEFSYARWGSAATNTNTMNIDMTGMLGAQDKNAPIKERYTLFDIIINYATKTITSYVENVNSDGKGTPKSATFTASLTNTKPIAAFNTWGFGVGGNTDRADSFDDLIIKTTEGDYNVVSANYTVNWVCGSDIVKTETRTGDVGSAIVLLEADKEKFYTFSDDKTKKYQYVSDNTEGLTIADGGTTVVEIKLSEVGKYTYSVVDNWGNTIVSGEQFEDEAQMAYWSKYAKNDGKWYQASGEEFGMEMNNVDNEWTVNYSTESSISYFFEAENLNKTKDPATEASDVKYSAGKGIGHYSGSTWYSEPLTEGGVYTLAIAGYARRSGGEDIGISIRDAEGNLTETGKSFKYDNAGTEQINKEVEGIEIPAGCSIALVQPGWNSTSYIDYITLTKTADLVQTYTVTISDEIENGTVVADPTSANAGAEVTLTNTPAEGYEFVSYSVTGVKSNEAVPVTDGKFTMPADDVTVSATFAKVYAVTISDEIENGKVVADPTSAKAGDEVTLTNTPAEGYEFVSYSVTGVKSNEAVPVTDGKFTMPADDVTVSATFQLPAPATYAVTIAEGIEGGTVVADPTSAKEGDEVTLTNTPAEGYEFVSYSVTGVHEELAVIVTDGKFTMPADDVTVSAEFKAVDPSGDEEVALAADMFYTWDGYGADASKIASATVDFKVGESVAAGTTVAGTGTVDYLTYADMTGSTKVIFEGKDGTAIRLLMNRQESNTGPLVEKTATIADGKAEISLTDLTYVHVNAIKIGWTTVEGSTINSITFVKPNDPLAGPKEALKDAIAAAKMQNSVAKTEESFAALTKAITDGEAALADAQATVESLTTAKSDIETAVKGLTLAEGYAEVTKEMFKQYASVDEPGEGTATGGAYELFTASGLPYGDGSVSELKWADLTKYDKLIVTVAGNVAPRLCMNRLVKDGQQAATQEESKMLDINPNNGNTWSTEKYQTASDGVYTIDLAAIVKDYTFARLHCIKAQGGGSTVVTGMYLHEAPAPVVYAVTIAEGIEGGTVAADPTSAKEGDEVTLTNTPAEGYEFVSYSVTCKNIDQTVIVTDGKFTMPADEVTVNATFQKKSVIYLETDLTKDFISLTSPTTWKSETPSGVGEATWAAPKVTVAGNKYFMIENYVGTQALKETTGGVMYNEITGLTPGLYTIELYGSAAVTVRDDITATFTEGDEASLNAVYLYAESNGEKVKKFIPCLIETNFNNRGGEESIPTATLDNVVVGNDGKIKIGLYKEVGLTNWHIVQLKSVTAKVPADAILAKAVADAQGVAESDVPAKLYSEIQTAIETYDKEYATADEYQTAINALNALVDKANGYVPLTAVLNEGDQYKANVPAEDPAIAAYDAAIADVKGAYDDAVVADIPAAVKVVEAALPALAKAQTAPGSDMTRAIVNPTINGVSGWTCDRPKGGGGPELPAGGALEFWAGQPTDAERATRTFDYYQVIEGLTPGKYIVSAEMYNSLNGEEGAVFAPTSGVYASSGNDETATLVDVEGTTLMRYATEPVFVKDGTLRLGVKNTEIPMAARWFVADNFTLTLVETIPTYEVDLAEPQNGAIEVSAAVAAEGDKVVITATPNEGYELESVSVKGVKSDIAVQVVTDEITGEMSFTMPNDAVEVSATFKEIAYPITYAIGMQNGTVEGPVESVAGEKVTLTVTPAEGYELENLTITCAESQNEINYDVVDYSFTMPKEGVYIIATFVQTTGIDAASAAKGKKIGVKKYFKNGELIIIGKDGKEFRANGAAK